MNLAPFSPQELDVTFGSFLKHLYRHFVPPPILAPVPTRIESDEYGTPVNPITRHTRGLRGFLGPLFVINPLVVVLLFAINGAPVTTANVVGVLTLIFVVSKAQSFLRGWSQRPLERPLAEFLLKLVLAAACALFVLGL